jgi:hypothetical protein
MLAIIILVIQMLSILMLAIPILVIIMLAICMLVILRLSKHMLVILMLVIPSLEKFNKFEVLLFTNALIDRLMSRHIRI